MYLDAADEANILLQGLGNALHQRGAISMAYDHNTDQPVYPYRVKQAAGDLVDSVAWHCYQSPYPNYTVLEDFTRAFPGTLQFMTECTNYIPSGVNFQVAQSFMPPVRHGASGAAMWVLATDPDFGPHSPYGGCAGCEGSVIVNSSTTYTLTNDYYMVGQFSRFVRRGAVNHQVLQGNDGSGATSNQFYVLAFQNPDKSWAVIFMNNYGSDQDVVLSFSQDSTGYWEGTIPENTVVTWLIPSASVANQTNGTSTGAPYPFTNGTSTFSAASGTSSGAGTTSACPSSSSSTSSSSSATVIPVPDTTHTIATTGISGEPSSASSTSSPTDVPSVPGRPPSAYPSESTGWPSSQWPPGRP
jgi:glucan endo-1,6-beta-glucosidase